MSAGELRVALQAATPRSLEGTAPFLFRARMNSRMGIAGTCLFMLPFIFIVIGEPDPIERKFGSVLGLLLIWALPVIAVFKYRARYINRLWREGRIVPGVLRSSWVPPNRNGVPGTEGRFVVSFTTPVGEERAGTFYASTHDFVKGQAQVLVVEEITHRAGLVGAKHLHTGVVVPMTRA